MIYKTEDLVNTVTNKIKILSENKIKLEKEFNINETYNLEGLLEDNKRLLTK